MFDEGLRLVLNEQIHRIDMGVDKIAEDKVNDPVPASEGNGGLGPEGRQREKSLPFTSGQYKGKNLRMGHYSSFP
jgi:hypothetical protein